MKEGASMFLDMGAFLLWKKQWGLGIKLNKEGKTTMNEMFQMQGTCLTILLPTELDHPQADRIRKEAECLMERCYVKSIVFDFKNTVFMDSSGIGMIMGRYRAMGLRGGSMKAVHVNDRIYKILRLSGVYRFITISREGEPAEIKKVGG